MDDFARRVIGRIDRVDLPAPGTAIQAGRTAFTVVQGDRRIDFMAPFDGRVCALNELVNPNIGRLAEDPYGWGWLMRVRPDDPANLSHELTPTDAPEAWMGKEAARLMAFVAPRIHVPAEIGRTMHDGGAFVDGLVEVLDDDTVQKLVQEFFR
jgi:glycine cleavage system H protein